MQAPRLRQRLAVDLGATDDGDLGGAELVRQFLGAGERLRPAMRRVDAVCRKAAVARHDHRAASRKRLADQSKRSCGP